MWSIYVILMFMQKEDLILHLIKQGFSEPVVKAFENIRREDFIAEKFLSYAYDDCPLPLGENSTISQPSTIAFMLDLLELYEGNSFLEIGSGCGYVLALVNDIIKDGKIYGVEINETVCEFSQEILKDEPNINIFCDDGKAGLPEYAPFDRILISAACPENPYYLAEQLNNDGIIVASVENSIVKIVKRGDEVETKEYYGFRFVPLI